MPYGSFEIQGEAYETLGEPKTEEGCVAKADPCSGGRLTDRGPGDRPRRRVPPLVGSVTPPFGCGPATTIQQRSQQKSHPPVPRVTDPLTSVLTVDSQAVSDPEAVSGLALATLSLQSCLLSDQTRDTPIYSPEADLQTTV